MARESGLGKRQGEGLWKPQERFRCAGCRQANGSRPTQSSYNWRPHLDEAEFLRSVERQSFSGYELVGAFRAGALVAVLGMRPVHTLARGPHLHIDDLVADEAARRTGLGRALMGFAEADAHARGMAAVHLDARPAAIPFYTALGYAFHPSPSMRKVF